MLLLFYYLMKLHYSQTYLKWYKHKPCFTTLWNYTILKHHLTSIHLLSVLLPYEITLFSNVLYFLLMRYTCFTTLWNYTILKHRSRCNNDMDCFTTLWNYTILKHLHYIIRLQHSFTTLWNYTILKPIPAWVHDGTVLLPYEITLFSNLLRKVFWWIMVLLPYEITLFSNLK